MTAMLRTAILVPIVFTNQELPVICFFFKIFYFLQEFVINLFFMCVEIKVAAKNINKEGKGWFLHKQIQSGSEEYKNWFLAWRKRGETEWN